MKKLKKSVARLSLPQAALFTMMFLTAILSSCENGGKIKYYPTVEEMNRGVLKVQCDEALRSIVEQQVEIFELNFPEADVQPEYLPEQQIVDQLLKGEIRTAILSRKLSENELKRIAEINDIKPREHVAAKNAVALVVSRSSIISKVGQNDLTALLQSGTKTLVMQGKESFMAKSVAEALKIKNINAKVFAMNTVDSVVSYIANNDEAIGFIAYNEISDPHSYRTKQLLTSVAVLPIEVKDGDSAYLTSANQSDIFLDDYPLVTPVNYIVTNFKDKLSIGFANYLFKAKAGRIFLHAGLVPSVMPEREIVIDTGAVGTGK